jgi:hypothetical protein
MSFIEARYTRGVENRPDIRSEFLDDVIEIVVERVINIWMNEREDSAMLGRGARCRAQGTVSIDHHEITDAIPDRTLIHENTIHQHSLCCIALCALDEAADT